MTRKITRAATRIKLGLQDKLYMGNLDAKRDWGFAGDYVHAMWLMLQQDKPDDFVIATGRSESVLDFLESVFCSLGLDYREYVERDERHVRPLEVNHLHGDASKAERVLGWKREVRFEQLVHMMVESDMQLARKELLIKESQCLP